MSFRQRLTVLVAVAIAVTVAAASLGVWLIAKHQLQSQVDAQLRESVPQALSSHGPGAFGPAYVVLDSSGAIVRGNLANPLNITPSMKQVATGKRGQSYGSQTVGDIHARYYSWGLPDGGAVVTLTSLEPTDKALHRIGLWIFIIGGIGIAAAAALAAFVATAALRPVRRLTAAAETVASTGNLNERVAVVGSDELGRLAARFNEMLVALERSVGAQRRLVADASHELRTPLTAARTNVDLLREGKLPEEEARHALDEAAVELDALTRLVSDLVELARGEERKLRIEELNLDHLVEATVERARARSPQATFVTALSPTVVQADPVLLERAVSNLLDNAVKYSPAGAPIEVSVRSGEVVVQDHGPGIADEDLPRVFDRFYRAATSRSKPGAGLGLAIVREAAEAHGGTATAESTPAGARFRLALPASA
jgi:two-component system, OmpR family, sensor histidine kinase MprB